MLRASLHVLAAEPADALALQPPLADDGLKIVPGGETALLRSGRLEST